MQGAMRACLGAGVVVARLESVIAGVSDDDVRRLGERVKWRVELLEEREKKGGGEWVVPVVDVGS